MQMQDAKTTKTEDFQILEYVNVGGGNTIAV